LYQKAVQTHPKEASAYNNLALCCSKHGKLNDEEWAVIRNHPLEGARLTAPLAGWLSVACQEEEGIPTGKNEPFKLLPSAHRYEFGTFNLIPILGFGAALDYMESLGFENIRGRIRDLTDHLIRGLTSLGVTIVSPIDLDSERSAIVSFTLGQKNAACFKKLEAAKVYVSLRSGYIRVSVNFFNNLPDIDRLLGVLRTL